MKTGVTLPTMKTGTPNVSFGLESICKGKRDVYRSGSNFHINGASQPSDTFPKNLIDSIRSLINWFAI